jgi:hypothetical protein
MDYKGKRKTSCYPFLIYKAVAMKLTIKILNNLKYKIIVILLAILIWFFVKTEDNYSYSFDVPIQINNLEKDHIIVNDLPKNVEAIFWGKGRALFSLMLRRDVSYNVDVANLNGNVKINLDKGNIRMFRKADVDVLNIIHPKEIDVVLSKLLVKKVPIVCSCDIKTLPGYTMVDELRLEPDSVVLKGPEKELVLISSVFTEKKSFHEVKRDFEKKVKLIKPEQTHVTLDVDQSKLSADIQKLMEKRIVEIPVTVTHPPGNASVSVIPSTLSLILEGGTEILLNVTHNDISAYIDYDKVVASNEKYHPAYIVTPPGIRYRDVKPMRFKIVVERKHGKS